MPTNQSAKTERDREFRELDSSISSNLSERERRKEREEQRGKERMVGAKMFGGGSRVRMSSGTGEK